MPRMIQLSDGSSIPYDPTLESGLYRADEIPPEVVWGIIKAAKDLAFVAARKAYPTGRLICRCLQAGDLERTNKYNEWITDTSGTANAWEDHLIDSETIADGVFVAIYGLRMMQLEIADSIPISAVKFLVGGSEVARWDITKAYHPSADGVTLANYVNPGVPPPLCVTDAPLVVSEGITLEIDQWVATATTTFVMALEGIVVEKEGITLKP